ncbi:MAG: hypothetical protein TYPL_1060 [Candidatus Tyloplasma litorale]|nr:MAG: hypothetical protein TYPL_1060 [Mycoplasmatales bacterium]
MKNKKQVLLIDGNSLLYKSFYASYFLLEKQSGRDDRGNPINALRTFSTMIINLIEIFENANIFVAFDKKGLETYRTSFSFYKDNRKKMPEELIIQKPLIVEFLNMMGIKHFSSIKHEADDIIGILAKKFSKQNIKVEIITSDKDLLQLVDDNISIHISKTGVSEMINYNKFNFNELYYGLNPNQVIELKGIMGDSSDNLKGIKGIGEKGAVSLLKKYGTLENIYENKNELSNSLKSKLEEGIEMGRLCKKIATIMTNDDININFESLSFEIPSKDELINFLRYYSIHSLANKLERKWF